MAAGGLSYSGLVNHGKVNLPSVESWGTNMNILKDPPKSITTRRKNKVGETSFITQMIDESDGRTSEAIQVYARGVNPFVSVSYDNVGNNGGRTYGGIIDGGGRSAKLPHRIMQDGAFRPPIMLQQDLLPLSRLPRTLTNAFSNAGFADFSRKLRTCGTDENTKEVKKNTLKTSVRPTAVYRIEKQAEKPFEIKYAIQPSIKNSVSSGIRTMDITQRNWGTPTKEINNDLIHSTANSAISNVQHVNNNEFNGQRFTQDSLAHPAYSNISLIGHVDNNKLDTERYLQQSLARPVLSNLSSVGNYSNENNMNTGRFVQDSLSHSVGSNVSSNARNTSSIDDILDLSNMPVHNDIIHYNIKAPVSGVEKTEYFHDDISLSRTLPNYVATTNVGDQKVYKRENYDNQIELQRNNPSASCESNPTSRGDTDYLSRDARLAPKINAGSYSARAQLPIKERDHLYYDQESEKAKMNRMVMESMNGRFNGANPFTN